MTKFIPVSFHHRALSPVTMGLNMSKDIEIDVRREDIGKVIGKGGSVLRSIEEESGAKISIDRERCKIRVTSEEASSTHVAYSLINRILNPPSLTIEFDKKMAGRIIGPRGSTVKQIQNESQTRLSIDTEAGTIKITAESESRIRVAENMILTILHPPTLLITCDPKYFGRIIGPRGSTIKNISSQSGARVSLDQKNGTIEIVGDEEIQVRRARSMISEIIQAPSVQVSCPREVLGQIIGTRGEHIKAVQRETRTLVEVLDTKTPGPVNLKITSLNEEDLKLASKVLQEEIQAAMKAPDYTGKEGARLRMEASEWAVKREHLFESAHEAYVL